jgi:hypothetical protein
MPVGKRKAARFIMVAGRIIRQPVAIARPGSVHGMIFKAPLMRVNVELPAAAPLTSAAVVIVITIADGTAWAELVVIAPTMMEPVELAPRIRKKRRSFSRARPIRIRAASSPTCIHLMSHLDCWKLRCAQFHSSVPNYLEIATRA